MKKIEIGNKKIQCYGKVRIVPDTFLVFKDKRYKEGIRLKLFKSLTQKELTSLFSFGGKSKLNRSFLGVVV